MKPLPLILTDFWMGFGTHLWQTTLVILGAMILERLFRHLPARLLNAIWNVALAKSLVPLAVLGGVTQGALALCGLSGETGVASRSVATPVGEVLFPLTTLRVSAAFPATPVQGAAVALSVVWIAGVCWGLRRLLRAWKATSDLAVEPLVAPRASARERMLPGGELEGDRRTATRARARELVALAASRAGIPPEHVALAEGIPMPCVMGLRRPRILIPSRLAEQLGAAGLRALLLHEDAHRQRHEPLREAVLEVIACLLFLLPLVRTACRRLRESSEFVCDEHVLRAGVAGPLYARALSASVQAAVWSPPLALASGAHRGSRLQRRFVRLLQPGRFVMKHPHRVAAAALAGLFVLGILVPAAWIGGCGGESSEQVGPGGPADNPAEEALTRPQTMPELLEMDPPVYPEAVRREGVQGIVVVRGLLRAEGHVDSISAVEGPEQLRESAIASLRTARFRPATQEGMPVDTWVQLPFQFSLD